MRVFDNSYSSLPLAVQRCPRHSPAMANTLYNGDNLHVLR